MLAFYKGVAADAELQCAVDKWLGNFIQIDEQSSGTCVDIKGFVKIFAVVDSLEDATNDGWYRFNFGFLGHKVDFVVEGLSDLKNRMYQKSIIEFGLLLTEESEHFLAQLLFHGLWEVIQQAK